MTFKVQQFSGMRSDTLYSGTSECFAGLVYDAAVSAVRFSGGTAAIQMRCEESRKPIWYATTPITDGRSDRQTVSYPGASDVAGILAEQLSALSTD